MVVVVIMIGVDEGLVVMKVAVERVVVVVIVVVVAEKVVIVRSCSSSYT